MANRQGKLTDRLLREEGMGGRKGNLCNGRIPMIKTLIQFTHKSNPERLKNYNENASGYSSIYIISWIMISRGCFGFWLIS